MEGHAVTQHLKLKTDVWRGHTSKRNSPLQDNLQKHQQNSRAGLTLLELLIVVSILSIMATTVLTSENGSEVDTLQSVARIVVNDLRLARNLSIQHNTEFTVAFDFTENQYELLHTGSGSAPMPEQSLAGTGDDPDTYIVSLSHLAAAGHHNHGIRLGIMLLKNGNITVDRVTFGSTGGTGPARAEDSMLYLIQPTGIQYRICPIRISWVTGQIWVQDFIIASADKVDKIIQDLNS